MRDAERAAAAAEEAAEEAELCEREAWEAERLANELLEEAERQKLISDAARREAEAAVKAGEMFVDFAAEEDLLSPAGAHVGLGHEGLEWDAVEPLKRSKPADAHTELKHENGSDRSYTPPLTPSG